MTSTITLEPISAGHALVYKVVRLRALFDSPTAFGSTYASELMVSDAQWRERAEQCEGEARVGFIAMDGESACGLIRATPDDQDAAIVWVQSMWVAPSHRRRGIGQLLLDKILVWAGPRGISALKLSVTSSNKAAMQFYERFGFLQTGKTEPYPNDAALVECEMLRPLSSRG